MLVAGVSVSAETTRRVSLVLSVVFLLVAMLHSLAQAVLLMTCLGLGIGSFSLILDLCPKHEVPVLLPSFSASSIHKALETSALSSSSVLVAPEVDVAVTRLLDRLLQVYVMKWYDLLTENKEFIVELRRCVRLVAHELLRRLLEVNLATLITKKGLPLAICHVDNFRHAKVYAEKKRLRLNDAYFALIPKATHPASRSRRAEVVHLQQLTSTLLPTLIPTKYASNTVVMSLLTDIVSGGVLLPLLDLIADPDTLNFLIDIAFDPPDNCPVFNASKQDYVNLLDNFVNTYTSLSATFNSTLSMEFSDILKDQQTLFAFMQFLKADMDIHHLQFVLSVEDFNKRVMEPGLSGEDLVELHVEAKGLFDLYLKADAACKVNVDSELVQEIEQIISGCAEGVVELKSRPPLFKAYEQVFAYLESLCPPFFKSEQFFFHLVGRRGSDTPDGSGKQNRRGWRAFRKRLVFKKSKPTIGYSTLNRIPTPAVRVAAPSDDDEEQTMLTVSRHSRISIVESRRRLPGLALSTSDIDLTRTSALATLSKSRKLSSANRSCSIDDLDQDDMESITLTTKPRHERSLSLQRYNKEGDRVYQRLGHYLDKDFEDNRRIAEEFQSLRRFSTEFDRRQSDMNTSSSVNTSVEVKNHKKGRVLVPSESRREMSKNNFDRSKSEASVKKLGRSLARLKQNVMGKSVEGLIDPVDNAFDVASLYNEKVTEDDGREEDQGDQGFNDDGDLDDKTQNNDSPLHRDLATWSVSIPRLSTALDNNGKACFVFVIQISEQSNHRGKDEAADNSRIWTIQRRFDEFYALESKLTEFYGSMETRLPYRGKIFTAKGLDVLQSKLKEFEGYLQHLLSLSTLKESDLLYTFLTSTNEFSLSNIGHRMIRSVPKLVNNQKSNPMQAFVNTFVASTVPSQPKPNLSYALIAEEHELGCNREVSRHPVFGDNLGLNIPDNCSDNEYDDDEGSYYGNTDDYNTSKGKRSVERGVFDTLVFVAATLLEVPDHLLRILFALRLLLRRSIDAFIDYLIAFYLLQLLNAECVAYLCGLIEGALFDQPRSVMSASDQLELQERCLRNVRKFLWPWLKYFSSKDKFDEATKLVHDSIQHPVINKHLALTLLEAIVDELFPSRSSTPKIN